MNIFALFILSIAGFLVAFRIFAFRKKTCRKGEDCDKVVGSDYGKIFGVPLHILGMIFYGVLTLFLFSALVFPNLLACQSGLFEFLILIASLLATILCVYLLGIQAFVLKSYCQWCVTLACITFLLAVFSILLPHTGTIDLFVRFKPIILMFHVLGVTLGVGGATITDIFFMRFIHDRVLTRTEVTTMKVLSTVIWVGLIMLIVTGVGLYLPNADLLNHTPKFLVKMIGVGVIIINGLILNFFITPRLTKVALKETPHEKHRDTMLRRLVFASGAVSLTSWYSVFLLGSFRNVPLSFGTLLLMFIGLLVIAVVMSQIFGHLFLKHKIKI